MRDNACKLGMAGRRKLRCSFDECTNQVQQGGLCIRHGAIVTRYKRRRCSFDGCTDQVQQEGLCIRQGAIIPRCSHELKGRCRRHGAKLQKIQSDGCTSGRQYGRVLYEAWYEGQALQPNCSQKERVRISHDKNEYVMHKTKIRKQSKLYIRKSIAFQNHISMDTSMLGFISGASHRHSLMAELGCNYNTTLRRLDLTLLHITYQLSF